ncbi:MAG: amidohydrolase family protein [Nocardioidaceae bacterium]
MTVDVHAHCIPVSLIEELERDGSRHGIEIVSRDGVRAARIGGRVETGPLRADLADVNARIAAMDRAGVDMQVLSSWIDLTAYALPADTGARYARMFNEMLAATRDLHPDRFLALCTAPLQSSAHAGAELHYAVEHLGMMGVEIATTIDGAELDDPALDGFWGTAQELGCLVLVHPYHSLAGRNVSRYFLGNLVGNPAETTIAVAHLIFGGVLERFPALRICVVHGGGFLAYQSGRLDRGYQASASLTATHLTRPPSEWLRRLYFDTVLHAPAMLRALVDLVGADHLVLGSDYPFEMGDPDPGRTVRAIPGLDDEERERILRGNLDSLLAAVRR